MKKEGRQGQSWIQRDLPQKCEWRTEGQGSEGGTGSNLSPVSTWRVGQCEKLQGAFSQEDGGGEREGDKCLGLGPRDHTMER